MNHTALQRNRLEGSAKAYHKHLTDKWLHNATLVELLARTHPSDRIDLERAVLKEAEQNAKDAITAFTRTKFKHMSNG